GLSWFCVDMLTCAVYHPAPRASVRHVPGRCGPLIARSSLGGGRLIPCARPDGMAGHGRRRHRSLRRLSADDWSSVMASEGSGQDTEGRCGMAQSSRSLLLGFAVAAFVWLAAPAWALGPSAPPIVSFSGVWISTTTTAHEPGATNGVPQLFASVDVLIP